MEDVPLAKQVADELKGCITASVTCVQEGDYQSAHIYLNQALSVCELLEYNAGSAIALHNLANLYAITGESVAALETAALALEKAQLSQVDVLAYQTLVHKLFLVVQKEGIDCVKNKEYARALACFEVGMPHMPKESKALAERQINLLRGLLNDRQGISRRIYKD